METLKDNEFYKKEREEIEKKIVYDTISNITKDKEKYDTLKNYLNDKDIYNIVVQFATLCAKQYTDIEVLVTDNELEFSSNILIESNGFMSYSKSVRLLKDYTYGVPGGYFISQYLQNQFTAMTKPDIPESVKILPFVSIIKNAENTMLINRLTFLIRGVNNA